MPELIMERPKMSLQMHENLKKFILRERRKKKEEDEQKMREEMKKAEIKTQTLEHNKEQIKQLQTKLEDLQLKRRELFSQLKKVLNEETNLKKSNRLSMPQTSVPGTEQSNPINPLLMYSGHPGHPQLLAPQNPQFVTQPPISNLPQPSPILSIPNIPSQSSQNSHNNPQTAQASLINKPQSPFHPPHLLPPHHLPPSNASNFLKYFQNQPMQISPQMMQNQSSLLMPPLNQNPISSPSSSPHLITSSPRHNLQPPPNIKRQRSPSPPASPLQGLSQSNILHNQFLLNQSQLMQQRSISPGNMIPSSPPPMMSQGNNSFSSPSSSKKIRNTNIPQSPQPMSRPPQQQSQSAFSSYLNRPGMPSFQSPSSQNKPPQNQQQTYSHPSHTPPGPGYPMSRGMPSQQQLGGQPPSSAHSGLPQMPANLQQFNHHYLNSLSQEQAKMILQQQAPSPHGQHPQQYMSQQYLGNMSSIPMISAAAVAAVAAAAANANNPQSGGPNNGGSIMTGFPIRNPNNN